MQRQPNSWIRACKQWNEGKAVYCVPRKGSKEYDEVARIRDEIDAAERGEVVEEEVEQEQDLIELMQELVDKYNLNAIKKDNITRNNVMAYYKEYASKKDKIQALLDKVDDQAAFIREFDLDLGLKYADVTKNILRRIKSQVKKSNRAL